jgi:hypothetical protein
MALLSFMINKPLIQVASIIRFIVTYRKPLITLKRSGGAGEKQRDAHNMSSY